MEQNPTNLITKDNPENANIDDQATENTIENQNLINSNNLNHNISIIEQSPKFNDSSPQLQTQQTKLIDNHIKTSNPTVIVELSDDDNDKELNDRNDNSNDSQYYQNNNISFQNLNSSNQTPTNRFLSANLSQGQTFMSNNENSFIAHIDPISNLTSHHENQFNPNLNGNISANLISNDENNISIPKNIPELCRSGQNDSNLYESKTPSNITTEENSPRSRPFSPETLNSPGSPPHVENYEQSEKNDELQFKTLSIYGNNDEKANNANNSDNEQNNYTVSNNMNYDNGNQDQNPDQDNQTQENENQDDQNENENQDQNQGQNSIKKIHSRPFMNQPIVSRINSNPYPNIFPNTYPQLNQNEFTGLQNQGATCYMNSMLQALYHLPIFRRFIYQMDYSEAASDDQNIPLNLQRLFAMMQLRIRPSVPTKELTNSFGWTAHETYMQHDVQEFCRVILDNIETKMKKQENLKDAIGYLFRGKVRSEIRLKTGEVENSTIEDFYDLSMIVKDTNSLEESFQKYIEPEEVSDYDTESGKQEITKTIEFVQFPPVLYIHLRRFEYDQQIQNMKKINSRFEFQESIDLSQYMAENADQTDDQIFDLFGVLVHNGSSYGGHYFAYLRPYGDEDEWYKFNDSSVTKVTKEEAIESNFGGSSTQNGISFDKSYSAYMLIYIRRSCIPEFYEEVDDSEIPESAANYVHEKKIKYERQLEEKKRIENTMSFKLVRNEDLRKNALFHNIEFNFNKSNFVSVDAMKYDTPEDLYQKVSNLLKLRKFILYEINNNTSFDEINRNSNATMQSIYSNYLFVYSYFRENRTVNRNRNHHYRRLHNHEENENTEETGFENKNEGFDPVNDNNEDQENYNEYENQNIEAINENIDHENHNENENFGPANENGENENESLNASTFNGDNENENSNAANENENLNADKYNGENEEGIKISDNYNVDERTEVNNEENNIDNSNDNENMNMDDNENSNFNEEEEENISIDNDDNDDYDEEDEKDDEDEEEEESSDERSYYNSYYSANPPLLVFYYIYVQNRAKYPIHFWRADLVRGNWKASRIFSKCDRVLKIYPINIYANGSYNYNSKFMKIDPNSRLRDVENGTIFILEIDDDLPPMLEIKDDLILQRSTEEEEEEEENNTLKYLDFYPTKSFQEFYSYRKKETFLIRHDEDEHIINVPYKIPNYKFIKFVKRIFKISKSSQLIFYYKRSPNPLNIFLNDEPLDRAIRFINDTVIYVYIIPSNTSFDLFRDNQRVLYYTCDGYMEFKSRKTAFMSDKSTVEDLINHKKRNSQKNANYRVVTIRDNKIRVEDPENYLQDLSGKIRVEEIPEDEEEFDFKFQLNISKEAAQHLNIYNRYRNKIIRKTKFLRKIECIYYGIDNEMLPDTKKRIANTFNCDEALMDDLSYTYEIPGSISSYSHSHSTIEDNEAISEYLGSNEEISLILNVDIIQQSNSFYSLPSIVPSRNQDSIYIQN